MNIGIDCGALSVKDDRLKTGVYYLNLNLLLELSKIDKVNQYWLYSFTPISKEILDELGSNFENRILTPQTTWLTVRLSLEFILKKPDLFIGLSQALPLYHPLKSIVFIYDLAFEKYPECYINSYKKLSWQTKKAVNEANKIIAISNSTKDDINSIYKISKSNINVFYPGVSESFYPRSKKEIENAKNKYNLVKPYILFLGSLKPIKNIKRIIESYELLPINLREKYQLVLAGSNYWTEGDMKDYCEKNMKKNNIKNINYIQHEDLPKLYSGAELFLSPSLYEGFGLPLVEAMACGCAVVTSNVSSMPEVVGNSGVLVDPKNSISISKAIEKILCNNNLKKHLREKAEARAKKFSWKSFAKNIFDIL